MQFKRYPLIIIGLCVFTSAKHFENDFYNGFNTLVREGKETEELRNSLVGVKFPQLFRRNYVLKQKNDITSLVCMVCDLALDILITASKSDVSVDLLANALNYLCINLGIESENVCTGVIRINKDTLFYILKHEKSKATSERICSMVLQDFKCIDNSTKPWQIPIPPKENVSFKLEKEIEKNTPIKVVQITDLHYDPKYEVGSNGNCLEPLCCQAGSEPVNSEAAAGYWGNYENCDLPWHSVIDTLNQIVIEHENIDYVYFTGDIINHKVWDTDILSNKEAIIKAFKQLRKSFGRVPVYPILGNHEPHPVNQFSYDLKNDLEISTKWIFQLAVEQWASWLPEDTYDTIQKGGYYTVKATDTLRIIALNSNVCYHLNFWLFYDDEDPFGQLKWLVEVLKESERNKEIVHILSHVPTGDSSCLHNWSNEYVKIIDRFSHIISAQFNGHTHNDDVVVFYASDNETPNNIAFNGGSLTTYTNLNPNYKVYFIDPSNYAVLDYESWTYNLTEANWNPQVSPKWYKLYNFKNEYDLAYVTPITVSKMVEKMAQESNSSSVQAYFKNKNRKADTALADGCDADCELENLCYIVTYAHENDFHCKRVTNTYNSFHPDRQSNNAK